MFGHALHLKINMAGCNKTTLGSVKKIKNYLDNMPASIGMTLIQESDPIYYEDKNPKHSGVTGVSILATSHISAHSFPAKGFLFIDIFSCDFFEVEDALEQTLDYFKPVKYKHWVTDRRDLFDYDEEAV